MVESPAGSCYSSENYVDSGGGGGGGGGTSALVARPWSSTDSYTSSVDAPSRVPFVALHHQHHPTAISSTTHFAAAATNANSVMQKAGSFGGYRQHFGGGGSINEQQQQHASPRRSNTGECFVETTFTFIIFRCNQTGASISTSSFTLRRVKSSYGITEYDAAEYCSVSASCHVCSSNGSIRSATTIHWYHLS